MPCDATGSPLAIYLTFPDRTPDGIKARMRRGHKYNAAHFLHEYQGDNYAAGMMTADEWERKEYTDWRPWCHAAKWLSENRSSKRSAMFGLA